MSKITLDGGTTTEAISLSEILAVNLEQFYQKPVEEDIAYIKGLSQKLIDIENRLSILEEGAPQQDILVGNSTDIIFNYTGLAEDILIGNSTPITFNYTGVPQ